MHLDTCPDSFPRRQCASFFNSTMKSFQGVLKVSSCSSSRFDLCRCRWQVSFCRWHCLWKYVEVCRHWSFFIGLYSLKSEIIYTLKVKVKVTGSCLTLCNPLVYRVHEIIQARILEWVAFPFSRGSSQHRDWTQVSLTADSLQLSHKGSPRIPQWVAYAFSSRSSWPRYQTGVSCTAGRFFTNWTIEPKRIISMRMGREKKSCM